MMIYIEDINDAAGYIDLLDSEGKSYEEILEFMNTKCDYDKCPNIQEILPTLIVELISDEE